MPELRTPAVEMNMRNAPQRIGKRCVRAVTLSGMCGSRVRVSAAYRYLDEEQRGRKKLKCVQK
jgi:hypothetical protein